MSSVLDKVQEEIDEVKQELEQLEQNPQKIEEELGDLLFAIVNLARHLKIKSELCLKQANKKFTRRFQQVESMLKQKNITLIDATLEQMETAWQSVKQLEQIKVNAEEKKHG